MSKWGYYLIYDKPVIEKIRNMTPEERSKISGETNREKIVENFAKQGYQLLEICTSDTHYAPVKARNRNGYYQLGLITGAEKLSKWFLEIANDAESKTVSAKFEILENETDVKIMGPGIYEDYSKALDNSLKITKGFMIGSVILFVITLFL